MHRTIMNTIKALTEWTRFQIVGACKSCREACEKHQRILNITVLVGFQLYAAYFSHVLLIALIALHLSFMCFVYKTWVRSMGSWNAKFPRSDPGCYSSKARPEVTRGESSSVHALDMSHIHVSLFPFL